MTAPVRDGILQILSEINIATDPETDRYEWSTTTLLSERYGLTLYDASYLELAQRLSLPLASLDKALREAGRSAGLPLLALNE